MRAYQFSFQLNWDMRTTVRREGRKRRERFGMAESKKENREEKGQKMGQEMKQESRDGKRKQKKTEEKKTAKRKPKYGILSCVAYMYRFLWRHVRLMAFVGIFTVPVSLAMSALSLYIPSITLRYLEKSERFSTVGLIILGLGLAEICISLADKRIEIETRLGRNYIAGRMRYDRLYRLRDRDCFLEYDPEIKKLGERAGNVNQAALFPLNFADMLSTILKFFLFGSIISLVSPWLILLLAVGCGGSYLASAWERKRDYEAQDRLNSVNKKINYVADQVAGNLGYAKDIRLYGFWAYLSELARRLLKDGHSEYERRAGRSLVTQLVDYLLVFIRDGAAYAFLIFQAVEGRIDAAQFVLYFSAVTQMAGFMSRLLAQWSQICKGALRVSDYREDLEVPDLLNRGPGIPVPQKAFSIEFKNVTFRYPQGEGNVLEHVSFRIEAGEKLALVGLNGAGKTTMTKLMCGLLLPTEGEILLDGHALTEYNRDELYTLFGLIPQNYNFLPVSIACNIACTDREETIDREKLARCIRRAGLEEKIASLPKGENTPLNRQINEDGTEFSGGEAQKLLLARLMYRSPKCMILDEPTAALDPLAEDRMYRQYSEIAGQEGSPATSIFISHRLASTRFCDRIFLLDGSVIAESGTHEELMAEGKKYRELFELQSRYYKEDVSLTAANG